MSDRKEDANLIRIRAIERAVGRAASTPLGLDGDVTTSGTTATIAGVATVDDGTSGTTKTIDWGSLKFGRHRVTLTGNVAFTFLHPADGGDYALFVNTGAGGFTPRWPVAVVWPSGVTPTITATASRVDLFRFLYEPDGRYYGTVSQGYSTDDGMEGVRVFGVRPERYRQFLPLRTGWIAHQAPTPVAAPFQSSMVSDTRPPRNRQRLGPKIPLPVSQTTHVSARFSPEMVAGSSPFRAVVKSTRQSSSVVRAI